MIQPGDMVFVTGASGGIGQAVCRQLAERGVMPIVAFSSHQGSAQVLAEELDTPVVRLDLSDFDENVLDASLAGIAGRPITGAVLAASPALTIAPLRSVSEEDMVHHWDVNVRGHWRLCQYLIDHHMKAQRRGAIVAVLTAAMGDVETKAAPQMGPYIIAKYGLMGLMRAIEAEYAWLKVDCVFPGYTETAMLEAFDPRFLDMMRKQQPNGRFATREEVAALILGRLFAI